MTERKVASFPTLKTYAEVSVRWYAQRHIADTIGHSRQSHGIKILLSAELTIDVGPSSSNENLFIATLLFRLPKQGQWQSATRKGKQGNQSAIRRLFNTVTPSLLNTSRPLSCVTLTASRVWLFKLLINAI